MTQSRLVHQLLCAMLLWVALEAFAAPTNSYKNPVLSGFHADPSICRVGSDYYLATSSFEYFPGVPLYHSKDLVHWRLIGHALTRESQLPLAGQESSKGIFAPTLRCHAGMFYLITTNIEKGGNFYVVAKHIAGPWSEPVWLNEKTFGMDPSLLFDDDGKVYYTRHGGGRNGGVYQAELDLSTGKLRDEARLIWSGTGGIWPEGPHLYKIGDFYYLMISEGGTSYEHSLTVARSHSPWGPFEAAPQNPILTHRMLPNLPLQAVGHGDLIQSATGNWWMVLLGIRPLARQHHLGRETLLTPVTWDADGWPVINQGEPLTKVMHSAGLPASVVWPIEAHREKFRASKLALHWSTLRGPATELMSLRERPGMLRLKGNTVTLNDVGTPAFVARRQEHMQLHAATQLDFTPRDEGQSAGLALRQNEANYVTVRVIGVRHRRVELVQRRQGISTIAASFPIKRGAVILQIDAFQDHYQFSVQQGLGKVHILGSTPTSDLSSETAGGFTGVFLGMVASTESKTLMPPADFSWFDYQAGEE